MPLLRRLQARDRGHPLGKSFRSWDDERVVFRSIRSETLFTDGEPRGFMLALVVGGPARKAIETMQALRAAARQEHAANERGRFASQDGLREDSEKNNPVRWQSTSDGVGTQGFI